MPSVERQDTLIDLYFALVHPELPVLDKAEFLKTYQNK